MVYLEVIISLVETLLYVALVSFIVSTLYLISVVKKSNYKIVRCAVTNPLFPNIDLNFFRKLQNEYLRLQKNKIPALINQISSFIMIIVFFLLFLLVIIQELYRY